MEHVRSIIMNRENIFKNNHTIEKNYEKISQIKKGKFEESLMILEKIP